MNSLRLDAMIKGWFVGEFEPSAFKTSACEVAIKTYQKGDCEAEHYHKVATEITVIQQGRVMMLDQEFVAGDIIVIQPFEKTAFEALEDTVTVVVKVPGALDDKYQDES